MFLYFHAFSPVSFLAIMLSAGARVCSGLTSEPFDRSSQN